MFPIIGIIALHRSFASVDKLIKGERSLQRIDFIYNLLHFSLSEWIAVETVTVAVVLIENIGPVLNEFLFGRIFQDVLFPTILLEFLDDRFLKLRFGVKDLLAHSSVSLTNILLRQAFLMLRSFTIDLRLATISSSRLRKYSPMARCSSRDGYISDVCFMSSL